MILNITDKDDILNNFLTPISKVVDSVVMEIKKGVIRALIATNDNTIIVEAFYNDEAINIETKLNIPDVKKLCRVLQCIEEKAFDLNISSNNISYESNTIRFKYHLYDDNIISVPKLNLAKLDKLTFDGEFSFTHNAVIALIKGSMIATDASKIYLTIKDDGLFGELTDKVRANTDSYGLKLTDNYTGNKFTNAIPLNFEIFRIISSMKFNTIKGKLVSSMGVITLNMQLGKSDMKFILSALAN